MSISFQFGDIFKYRGSEFIYLAATEDIIYVAKILNRDDTQMLENWRKSSEEKELMGMKTKIIEDPTYYYVMLQTSDFKDQAAHLGRTQQEIYFSQMDKLDIKLADEDMLTIRNEIINSKLIPIALKKIVTEIHF